MQWDFCFVVPAVGRQVLKLCNGFAGLDEQVLALMSPLEGSDILHCQACFFEAKKLGQNFFKWPQKPWIVPVCTRIFLWWMRPVMERGPDCDYRLHA